MSRELESKNIIEFKIFTPKYDYKVTLEIKLYNVTGRKAKSWDTLEVLDSYKCLSISGNLGYKLSGNKSRFVKYSCGQINDKLRNIVSKEHFLEGITFKKLNKILDIWDKWHLNDLQAGTKEQEKHLESAGLTNASYTEKIEALNSLNLNENYKYGSEWLVKILPENMLEEIL